MRKYLLHVLIISFVFLSMPVLHSVEEENGRSGGKASTSLTIQDELTYDSSFSPNLRSSYRELSVSQVQSMSNISIRRKKNWGFFGHSTISHSYSQRDINGDNVVVDKATGLMWHQSGSSKKMPFVNAKEWVKSLNSRGYAGYNDWRLPTVEEATSLLESSKSNGRYIFPVFSKKQECIWTGDSTNGYSPGPQSEAVWGVDYYYGFVYWFNVLSSYCVRPVRSMK
jgi:hypothetical protein